MTTAKRFLPSLALALPIFLAAAAAGPDSGYRYKPAYPDGYQKWTRIKSMLIQEGHPLYQQFGGLHHVYANDKALKAMWQNRPYPNGAVLVFDLLEALEQGNTVVEGKRKFVAVMERDSNRFAATGKWGFEAFNGDTRARVVTDPQKDCFACHTSQKQNHYVFSNYRTEQMKKR